MNIYKYLFTALVGYSCLNVGYVYSLELKGEKLYIYKDGSILESTLEDEIKGTKKLNLVLPTEARNSVFFVSPSECSINLVRSVNIEENSIYLERKKRINSLRNKIKAIEFSINALEKVSSERFKDAVENVGSLETIKLNLEEKLYELEERYKKEKKEYDNFVSTFNPTDIFITCKVPTKVKLKVLSSVDIKGSNSYSIIANVDDRSITLKNNLKVISSRDLNNVKIVYYPTLNLTKLEPSGFINLKREEVADVLRPKSRGFLAPMKVEKVTRKIFETGKRMERPEYKSGYTQHFYVLKTPISLKRDVFQTVLLSTDRIENVKFKIFIDAYDTSTPYLMAELNSPKYFAPSQLVKFFIDETFIGVGDFNGAKKGEKLKLFFGKDNKVVVKKDIIEDYRETSFFGKEIHTYIVKYTIKNKHKKSIDVTFVDSVPPVLSEDVEVELLGVEKLKPKKYDKVKGKLEWEFSIPPEESFILQYGYKVTISK